MNALFQYPHGLIRRNLARVERILVAAGLAGVVYLLTASLPAYPVYWDVVLVGAVFLAAVVSPPAGYFLAVAVAVPPIYSISLYLLVIFLVIALLGYPAFIHNLEVVIFVAATPLLASVHLGWLAALLGGLWFGALGGAWVGGLAALWGLAAAGMAGLPADWLALPGMAPSMQGVIEKFSSANSLQTLLLLVEPVASNATVFLYTLLQVVVWALAAALTGKLNDRPELQKRRPWGLLLPALAGGLLLPTGLAALNAWLGQTLSLTTASPWANLGLTTLLVILVANLAQWLRDFFEHPLPPLRLGKKAAAAPLTRAEPLEPVPFAADLPKWQNSEDEKPDDLIKIELD